MAMRPHTYAAGVIAGAALGIAVIAGWYAVTPRMTVEAMASAASAGDHERLSSYMDMTSLRADVRRRASGVISDKYPPGAVILDPERVTEALAGRKIDETFSRSGTRRMLEKPSSREAAKAIGYLIRRDGPNHFTARLEYPRSVDLLFSRRGLSWRLTGIALRKPYRPDRMI